MSDTDPQYKGQTKTAWCFEAKGRMVQVAKYRDGVLLWWCRHTKTPTKKRAKVSK